MNFFYLCVFAFVVGCNQVTGENKESVISDNEAAIFERVLRYAFENNASAQQNEANFYAIELDGHDAPSNFIARFDDIKKPIYPLSKTKLDCKKGVYLKKTNRRGIQFFVNSLEHESTTKIKVTWGYSEGCMSSALSVMTLELKEGIWIVLDDEVIVIS